MTTAASLTKHPISRKLYAITLRTLKSSASSDELGNL